MSYYISKVEPIFKGWRLNSIPTPIDMNEFTSLINLGQNFERNGIDRYVIISIQNPEYRIKLFYSENNLNSILISGYPPQRFRNEFISHLYKICHHLNANLYSMGRDGESAIKFNFEIHRDALEATYAPRNEVRYTDTEVDELLGVVSIHKNVVNKIPKILNLRTKKLLDWSSAIQECYNPNNFVFLLHEGSTLIIGQSQSLLPNYKTAATEELESSWIELLSSLSERFGIVTYEFNASRYGHFEEIQTNDGELIFRTRHSDGIEEELGSRIPNSQIDLKSICFNPNVQGEITIYELNT